MSTLPPDPVLLLGGLNLALGLASLASGQTNSSTETARLGALQASVALFVPCCGDEPGLEANLEALLDQDYSDVRIHFVVESASDAAVSVIERCRARHPGKSELVIAGPASGRSQKVHNLSLAAAREAGASPADVLAFADSDGRPPADWLRHLVSGLERPTTGVASSYRFYVPEGDPPGFAGLLRSVWNLSVASLLGDHGRNFAWGGAMALRRDVFDAIEVQKAWRGALSDDYAVTRAIKRAGLRVHYVPEATVPSFGEPTLREVLDWTTRQIRITRVYWPSLFYLAAASHLAYAGFLFLAPFSGPLAIALLGAVLLMSAASGARRARRSRYATRHLWAYALLVPLASLVTAQGVLRALGSRKLWWRGKRYEMRSPDETILLTSERR